MNSPVSLWVSPAALTPIIFYSQRFWGFLFPWWKSGFLGLSCSPVVPPSLSACKCGTSSLPASASTTGPATSHLSPGCPSPPLLPVWMNVSSFNSLVVGLSYSSIFWQFWLFFVFKFVVFLLVVRGGKVYLPMPPYWPKSTFFMHIRSLDAQNECLMKNIICCHLKGLGVSKVQ